MPVSFCAGVEGGEFLPGHPPFEEQEPIKTIKRLKRNRREIRNVAPNARVTVEMTWALKAGNRRMQLVCHSKSGPADRLGLAFIEQLREGMEMTNGR